MSAQGDSLAWRDKAACRGVERSVFFPHDTLRHDRWDEGLAFCNRCEVRRDCLLLALSVDAVDDKWGLFGGFLPGERRAMRRGYGDIVRTFSDGLSSGVQTSKRE